MINQFRGKYDFLSNFYLCKVEYEGLIFPSVEHAYQCQKVAVNDPTFDEWATNCQALDLKSFFTTVKPIFTPGQIKRKSYKVNLRPDWEEVKLQVMRGVLLAKFKQNKELLERLLETGERELQEGNTWNDVFWGVDLRTGYGENHLGRLLMEVRLELSVNGEECPACHYKTLDKYKEEGTDKIFLYCQSCKKLFDENKNLINEKE